MIADAFLLLLLLLLLFRRYHLDALLGGEPLDATRSGEVTVADVVATRQRRDFRVGDGSCHACDEVGAGMVYLYRPLYGKSKHHWQGHDTWIVDVCTRVNINPRVAAESGHPNITSCASFLDVKGHKSGTWYDRLCQARAAAGQFCVVEGMPDKVVHCNEGPVVEMS